MQSILPGSTLDAELTNEVESFIPGLPDDVALQCILRVPINKYASCKTVCKRWHALLGSKEQFFSTRKLYGFRDPWLIVPVFNEIMGEIKWKVLDLTHLSWHTIPSMPCNDKIRLYGNCCVSISRDGVLFVCGGYNADTYSESNLFFKYEIFKDQWTVMENMITNRMYFSSGVIDGMVYVAGGVGADNTELDSAEVFDSKTRFWRPVSKMLFHMKADHPYRSVVLDGKLYAIEFMFNQRGVSRGQVYDPVLNTWENMALGMRKGWTGPTVVVHGRLFVITKYGSTKLEVYNEETDSWDVVEGTAMPETIRRVNSASCWEGQIYVVCENLHAAVGYITNESLGKRSCRFCVKWEEIDPPEGLSSLRIEDTHVLLA